MKIDEKRSKLWVWFFAVETLISEYINIFIWTEQE